MEGGACNSNVFVELIAEENNELKRDDSNNDCNVSWLGINRSVEGFA